MNSALIGKIEKARRYAEERNRIRFDDVSVAFDGEIGEHTVSFHQDTWPCSWEFFQGWGLCSHTMALERVLRGMLPSGAMTTFDRVLAATP